MSRCREALARFWQCRQPPADYPVARPIRVPTEAYDSSVSLYAYAERALDSARAAAEQSEQIDALCLSLHAALALSGRRHANPDYADSAKNILDTIRAQATAAATNARAADAAAEHATHEAAALKRYLRRPPNPDTEAVSSVLAGAACFARYLSLNPKLQEDISSVLAGTAGAPGIPAPVGKPAA